jgi:hypothetical protein
MRRECHRLLIRSTSTPFSNFAPALTSATRWAELTAGQRCRADSMSLNAIAIPAAREPGPLVTRRVARSIGLVVRRWIGNSADRGASRDANRARRPRRSGSFRLRPWPRLSLNLPRQLSGRVPAGHGPVCCHGWRSFMPRAASESEGLVEPVARDECIASAPALRHRVGEPLVFEVCSSASMLTAKSSSSSMRSSPTVHVHVAPARPEPHRPRAPRRRDERDVLRPDRQPVDPRHAIQHHRRRHSRARRHTSPRAQHLDRGTVRRTPEIKDRGDHERRASSSRAARTVLTDTSRRSASLSSRSRGECATATTTQPATRSSRTTGR